MGCMPPPPCSVKFGAGCLCWIVCITAECIHLPAVFNIPDENLHNSTPLSGLFSVEAKLIFARKKLILEGQRHYLWRGLPCHRGQSSPSSQTVHSPERSPHGICDAHCPCHSFRCGTAAHIGACWRVPDGCKNPN